MSLASLLATGADLGVRLGKALAPDVGSSMDVPGVVLWNGCDGLDVM